MKRILLTLAAFAALVPAVGEASPAQQEPPSPTHGADHIGTELASAETAATSEPGTAQAIYCGTGGGRKVHALYVRVEGTHPDGYAQFAADTRRFRAPEVEAVFNADGRHVRWVTKRDCTLRIANVVLPAGTAGDWNSVVFALIAKGYDRPDRVYMIWTEFLMYCGVGTWYNADQKTATNPNVTNATYARVDKGCWDWDGGGVEGHELGHAMGAVNTSSPNSDGSAHCRDEYDLMCYTSGSTIVCAGVGNARDVDCNKDDYFNVAPAAGSYLATHWNLATDNPALVP